MILTDAGREDDGIETAERCGQPGDLAGDAQGEEVDRFLRLRRVAVEKVAAVGADAGNAEEPGFVVEEVFQFLQRLPLAPQEMQQYAGIERPAARRHRNTIKG
ncbi:hypothetical protein D3C87_1790870 [compost metagenome]